MQFFVTFHDGVVRGLMDTNQLLAQQARLEERLRATKMFFFNTH